MSTPNRTAILNRLFKAVKKQYKVPHPRGEQSVLESLLFAGCLENARWETADRVFAQLRGAFFDWNEIRVSTVRELAEVLSPLPEPELAAGRVKGILQTVFETDYSFDLEQLKKQNLGQAVKRLQKLEGVTPFVVSYAVQMALGGHSIPVDRGALGALYIVGVVSQSEAAAHQVPGMERAIPKSKGQEFGLLLHELGAELVANPFSPTVREFLLSIAPDAKDRLPKRKKPGPEPEPAPEKKPAAAAGKPAAPSPHKKPGAPPAPAKGARRPSKAAAPAPKKKPLEAKKKTPARQLAKRKPR